VNVRSAFRGETPPLGDAGGRDIETRYLEATRSEEHAVATLSAAQIEDPTPRWQETYEVLGKL